MRAKPKTKKPKETPTHLAKTLEFAVMGPRKTKMIDLGSYNATGKDLYDKLDKEFVDTLYTPDGRHIDNSTVVLNKLFGQSINCNTSKIVYEVTTSGLKQTVYDLEAAEGMLLYMHPDMFLPMGRRCIDPLHECVMNMVFTSANSDKDTFPPQQRVESGGEVPPMKKMKVDGGGGDYPPEANDSDDESTTSSSSKYADCVKPEAMVVDIPPPVVLAAQTNINVVFELPAKETLEMTVTGNDTMSDLGAEILTNEHMDPSTPISLVYKGKKLASNITVAAAKWKANDSVIVKYAV